DAIQVPEIGIAAFFLPDGGEVQQPVLLVDVEHLCDVALAARDRALLAARLEVVEIKMAPVVGLPEPAPLVRSGQEPPVDAAVARLEERFGFLFQDVAHRAGGRVGDSQLLVAVIARRGYERDRRSVRAPLNVPPLAPARDVVAQRGAM